MAPMRRLVVVFAALLPACGPTPPRTFDSPEPAARIDAIVDAAATEDKASVPGLVRMLESDDPATRLVAIRTLERMTGTTLGYDHAANQMDRDEAVVRWDVYASEHPR